MHNRCSPSRTSVAHALLHSIVLEFLHQPFHIFILPNQMDFFETVLGSVSWTERARARLGRKKYEALLSKSGENVTSGEIVTGDEALNSTVAFAKREKLKRHPLVKEALGKWWRCVLNTIQRGRPGVSDLRFDEYRLIYRSLYYHVLGADTYRESEADEAAIEEFASDSHGGEMDETAFCKGMFE